jgi:tetratricopeptide (TPR) repeat protein
MPPIHTYLQIGDDGGRIPETVSTVCGWGRRRNRSNGFRRFTNVRDTQLKQGVKYTNLGNSYRALDRNEEAVAAYKEAIRLQPQNAIAYFGLGAADNELKLYEPAVKAFREALRLDPKYPNATNQLGLSYFYLKRYQDAATAFEDAIRMKPNDANALFNFGYLQTHRSYRGGSADPAPLGNCRPEEGAGAVG